MFNKAYLGDKLVKSIYLGTQKIKYSGGGDITPPPPVNNGLICHIRADTMDGNRLIDLSGNGNHFDIIPINNEIPKNSYIIDINGKKYIDCSKLTDKQRPQSITKGLMAHKNITVYITLGIPQNGNTNNDKLLYSYGVPCLDLMGTSRPILNYENILGERTDVSLFRQTISSTPVPIAYSIDENGNTKGYLKGAVGIISELIDCKPYRNDTFTVISSDYSGKFQGQIRFGELKIFNKVLTEEEIRELKY